MDIRSSLDLFDFQFLGADIFAALLHDSQTAFETFLGRALSLSR